MKRITTFLFLAVLFLFGLGFLFASLAARDVTAAAVTMATQDRTAADLYLELMAHDQQSKAGGLSAGIVGAALVVLVLAGAGFWLARLKFGAEFEKQKRLQEKQSKRSGGAGGRGGNRGNGRFPTLNSGSGGWLPEIGQAGAAPRLRNARDHVAELPAYSEGYYED